MPGLWFIVKVHLICFLEESGWFNILNYPDVETRMTKENTLNLDYLCCLLDNCSYPGLQNLPSCLKLGNSFWPDMLALLMQEDFNKGCIYSNIYSYPCV